MNGQGMEISVRRNRGAGTLENTTVSSTLALVGQALPPATSCHGILWLATLVLAFTLGLPAAHGAGIGLVTVNPTTIQAGTATPVVVTAVITDSGLLPGTVNLQQRDSSGRLTAILGALHDDGLSGDQSAGDHVYTLQVTLNIATPGTIIFQVSAAFHASPLRSLPAGINGTVSGTSAPVLITITQPANLSFVNITPTTVVGTVGGVASAVTINGVNAPVSNGQFSASVPLREGPNIITAASAAGNTATITTTLDTTPPQLAITQPPNGFSTTDASVTVSGIVNDIVVGTVNPTQAAVTVNGIAANVANRSFTISGVPLQMGANTIQAVGTDRVGNATTISITVNRIAPAPQQIRLVSGNNQTGSIGQALAAPLVVQLIGANNQPVSNTPVVFRVTQNNGLVAAAGQTPAVSALVNTDAGGKAQVNWTLGGRAGAGGNSVEATSAGFQGTAVFTATGNQGAPGNIVIDSGNQQTGAVSQPLPLALIAVVVDSGSNRLANVPVTFTVTQGGGNIAGQASTTINTDPDGRVAVFLTLGPNAGSGNNVVTATFPGNQGLAATFTASGEVPGDPANTTISGVIEDNSNIPIPGVTVRAVLTNLLTSNSSIVGTLPFVQTNAQGQFTIGNAPVGFVKLLVDGSTATTNSGRYPTLDYDIVTVAGQNNTVGLPIYLPALSNNTLCVTANSGGGTLTMPEAPGFALTFTGGQVTFPGGSKTGCVSATLVHPDHMPMVPGFGQQPRFLVTIQPAGAIFNPPAPIAMPNVDGLPSHAVTEMYSFDHDIGAFVAIGTGTVSADQLAVVSNPGVGVLKAGWHCGGDPTSSGGSASLSVSLDQTTVVKGKGQTFMITASGSPPQDGSYSWEIVSTQSGDDTGAFSITSGPPCANAPTCTATLSGVHGGKATLRVHFICSSTGFEVTADARVTIVEIKQITSTVSHVRNRDTCSNKQADFADDTMTFTNSSTDFAANPPLALARKTQDVTLACTSMPPATDPDVQSVLKWSVKRNPGSGGTPSLTPNGANATLGTDEQGSFNVACYADTNSNSQVDTDESQINMNLALVGIQITSSSPAAHGTLLSQLSPSASFVSISSADPACAGSNGCGFQFANTGQAAFYVGTNVTLTGGGADGKLGVDQIVVFYFQNFRNDTFQSNHSSGLISGILGGDRTIKEVYACDPTDTTGNTTLGGFTAICSGSRALQSYPVIDSNSAYPNGGITPGGVIDRQETNVGDSSTRKIEWIDSPAFGDPVAHTCDTSKIINGTSGVNAFVAYMAAYSTQAPHSYVIQNENNWTVAVNGSVASDATGKYIWSKAGSSGITTNSSTTGYPKNANDAGVMVYGPSSIGANALKNDGRN